MIDVSHETMGGSLVHSVCPICKSDSIQSKFEVESYRISTERFNVDICNNCGHGFTNPVPDQEHIGDYYKSANYISHTNSSESFFDVIYQKVRNVALQSKLKLIHKYYKGGKFIDYGSGNGHFVDYLFSNGIDSYGLEISDEARSLSPKAVRDRVFPISQLSELNEIGGFSMWHVLEHIYEPEVLLKQLAQKMTDGVGFIAVPNNDSYDAKYYKEDWAALDVPLHFSHFSTSSMKELLLRSGFELVAIKNMPFDAFYISMLSENKNMKGFGISSFKGAFRGLLSNIKGLDANMSSLIYVVKTRS